MAAYRRVYDSTCRLTDKNRDQLRNIRSVIEYGLPFLPYVFAGRLVHCNEYGISACSFHIPPNATRRDEYCRVVSRRVGGCELGIRSDCVT